MKRKDVKSQGVLMQSNLGIPGTCLPIKTKKKKWKNGKKKKESSAERVLLNFNHSEYIC